MKIFLPLLLAIIIVSCSGTKDAKQKNLPAQVDHKISLNMTLGDFLQAKSAKTELAKKEDFRTIYAEVLDGDPYVEAIVYYISNGDDPRLYEVITKYKNKTALEAASKDLFGVPNYKESEWRITRNNSFNLWAWTHDTKLVIVGMIPGTEWSDQNW